MLLVALAQHPLCALGQTADFCLHGRNQLFAFAPLVAIHLAEECGVRLFEAVFPFFSAQIVQTTVAYGRVQIRDYFGCIDIVAVFPCHGESLAHGVASHLFVFHIIVRKVV